MANYRDWRAVPLGTETRFSLWKETREYTINVKERRKRTACFVETSTLSSIFCVSWFSVYL